MKKSNWLIGAVVLLLIGWGLYYFLRAETPLAEQEPLPPAAPTILNYEGNTISEEKDGRKVWQITAETIEVNADTNNVALKKITATFFQEDGKQVVLTAPTGNLDHQSKDITLIGPVQAKSSDGATFSALETRWVSNIGHLFATGQVKLTRDDTVVTGDKMESDAKLEKVKVQGNAHVVKGGTP